MSIQEKVRTALSESRTLILGPQVLLGFQVNAVFQEGFNYLGELSRALHCVALWLMVVTIGLLVAPTMHNRIVESGEATVHLHRTTTLFADLALFPFATSLGIALFVSLEIPFGIILAAVIGTLFFLVAIFFWYGFELFYNRLRGKERKMVRPGREQKTPVATKIDQMLTEARLVLPGVQALMGFDLLLMLNRTFDQLPWSLKTVHVIALSCVALAMILLMAPAAFHRISFDGEDSEEFHRLGSWFVIIAPAPLMFGIVGDLYVSIAKALESQMIALAIAGVAFVILLGLWYLHPLWVKIERRVAQR